MFQKLILEYDLASSFISAGWFNGSLTQKPLETYARF